MGTSEALTTEQDLVQAISTDAEVCHELTIRARAFSGHEIDVIVQYATSLLDKAKRYRDHLAALEKTK